MYAQRFSVQHTKRIVTFGLFAPTAVELQLVM